MNQRVTGFLFACLLLPCASGQALLAEFAGPAPTDGYGVDVDSTVDLDGDGHPELVVGSPLDSTFGLHFGRVTIASSQDGQPLLNIFGTQQGQRLGWSLAVMGDLDLDGFPDVVVGLPRTDSSAGPDAGQVSIYSGLTGEELLVLHGPHEENELGDGVGAVGDVTGDGVPDFGAASLQACGRLGSSCLPGTAKVYSGASGESLQDYPSGSQLRPLGDINGDGRDDYIAWGNGSDPGVRLCSGATGEVLDSWTVPSFSWFAGGPAADIDGDGVHEYVFTAWDPTTWITTISVRSLGKPPLLSLELHDFNSLITDVDARADVTGDAVPDLVVGMPRVGYVLHDLLSLGAVRVYSLQDGSLQAQLDSELTASALWTMGGVVSVLADWNDDGVFDVVAGSSDNDVPPYTNFVDVFSVVANPGWANLGHSLSGAAGPPLLAGSGSLAPGAPVKLGLVGAAADAPVALVIGTGNSSLPFKGGVLVPSPDIVLGGLAATEAGSLLLSAQWPIQAPTGLAVFLQAWISDDSLPLGFAASNGLGATTQ